MKTFERTRFNLLQKRAYSLNRPNGNRFQVMYHQHKKFVQVGMYDTVSKKYTLSRDFELDFTSVLDEMEAMLDSVSK